MASNSIKLLTGNSHPELAKAVADRSVLPSRRPIDMAKVLTFQRLSIDLTKIMVLQYSNQETSVTIGESVRDEDGMPPLAPPLPLDYQLSTSLLAAHNAAVLTCADSQSSFSNPRAPTTSTTVSWSS